MTAVLFSCRDDHMFGILLAIIILFINFRYCNESIVYETLILIDKVHSMDCYVQGMGEGTLHCSILRKCIKDNRL